MESRLSSTGSDGIKVIEIDKGITSIGKNSFNVASGSSISEKNSVSEVILPPTLKEIKSKAFANLKKLDTLIIGPLVGKVDNDAFLGSSCPANLCYLGKDNCPVKFDDQNATNVAITMTKHYYNSDGKAESSSAVTDKFVPESIVNETLYENTEYDITKFPFSEKDKEYTWHDGSLDGSSFVNKNIASTKLDLYGKRWEKQRHQAQLRRSRQVQLRRLHRLKIRFLLNSSRLSEM